MTRAIRKAVLPVAGRGTRFLPATKALPKEMLPIIDRPLVQYAVEEAAAAGITDFIFVTGRGKVAIENHFDSAHELAAELHQAGKTEFLELINETVMEPGRVAYLRQQEALGLGHAIWCARNLVGDEPFAVLLPDVLIDAPVPCLQQLVEQQAEFGGHLLAVEAVAEARIPLYGIIDPSGEGRTRVVKGLVEKPPIEQAPSNLAITGRYLFDPAIFTALERQGVGRSGEVELTGAIAAGLGKLPIHALLFDGQSFDCGSKSGFVKATLHFALKRQDISLPNKAEIARLLAE
jgi:UTP--glucose-1-phosphate uridylyltransferase